MKVIVKENLGAEYTSDVISSCEQNGIQAIADYVNNEILFYDPRNWLYGRHSDMMKDASLDGDVFDLFNGKNPEFKKRVMKTTDGEDFKKFAVEWNALQKQESPDIIKTKQCDMIRMDLKESGGLDDPRDWSASEGEVEIVWTRDFPEFGIEAGNTDNFVVDYYNVAPDNEYDIESNGLRDEICRLISEEYPGLDFEPYDFDITNEREFWGDQAKSHVHPYDEKVESDIIKGIPNWAITYIMYGDMPDGLTYDDIEQADAFLDGLSERGISLGEPIDGTENEFNPHPAFGLACDTMDWSCTRGSRVDESMDTAVVYWKDDEARPFKIPNVRDIFGVLRELKYLADMEPEGDLPEVKKVVVGGRTFDKWDIENAGRTREAEDLLGLCLEGEEEDGPENGFEVEVEMTRDGEREVKKGDRFKFPVDLGDAKDNCITDRELRWYVDGAFHDYVRANGIGGKCTIWIHPNNYDILNWDALSEAVLGDSKEGGSEITGPEDIPGELSVKEGMKLYHKIDNAYDARTLDYDKFKPISEAIKDAVVKGLLKQSSIEELASEWFKDYGTMNGWGWKTSFKYGIARRLHDIHQKKHPDEHQHVPQRNGWRGWHEDFCSCGFGSSSDSSD